MNNIWIKSKEKLIKNKEKLPWITFFILLAIWIFHFINFRSEICQKWEDYMVSFSASLIEDIIFFTIFGVTLIIMQSKRPEENEFRRRVIALANNIDVTGEAREFLLNDIKKTLAYAQVNNVTVTLTSKSNGIIEVYCDVSSRIVNMCNDIPFEIITTYNITTDLKHDGKYGYIKNARIFNDNNPSETEVFVSGPVMELTKPKQYRASSEKFKIPSDGSATTEISYAFYIKPDTDIANINSWNFQGVRRYTERFNFSVINNTGKKIKLKIAIRKAEEENLDGSSMEEKSEEYILSEEFDKVNCILQNETLKERDRVLYYL